MPVKPVPVLDRHHCYSWYCVFCSSCFHVRQLDVTAAKLTHLQAAQAGTCFTSSGGHRLPSWCTVEACLCPRGSCTLSSMALATSQTILLMLMLHSHRDLSAWRCQAAPRRMQGSCLRPAQAPCRAMLLLRGGSRVHDLARCQKPSRQLCLWAKVDVQLEG